MALATHKVQMVNQDDGMGLIILGGLFLLYLRGKRKGR